MSMSSSASRLFLLLAILMIGTCFAAASPVIVPPLPPTVPHPGGNPHLLADASPVIVPPLPPTKPHGNGNLLADASPVIVPPLPPTKPHQPNLA